MTGLFANLSIRRRLRRVVIALVVFLPAAPSTVQAELTLPVGAEQTARNVLPNANYAVPTGPWQKGEVETLAVTGQVEQIAWRIPGDGSNTLGLLQAIITQMAKQGYMTLFECATDDCGGFDFRYATKVIPEPEMHVDLGNFHFASARRDGETGSEYLTFLVSQAGTMAFVQMVHVGQASLTVAPAGAVTEPQVEATVDAPGSGSPVLTPHSLEADGHIVLEDLTFASGATELGAGRYASLGAIAAYLAGHPDQQVVIVGHTDAQGTLAMNIDVSRRRAQSVMTRLISDYGVAESQVSAQGVGFLAPIASNLTDEGRHKNRRVEAVLASTR